MGRTVAESCGLLFNQANKRILGGSSLHRTMGNSEVHHGLKDGMIFRLGRAGLGMAEQSLSCTQSPQAWVWQSKGLVAPKARFHTSVASTSLAIHVHCR